MDITCSLFPKFFKDLDADGLVALCQECQLDTINAVVRDGYWIEQSNLAQTCAAFCQAMRSAGMQVFFATAAGLDPFELAENPEPLRILWDNGITHVRIGYFSRNPQKALPSYIDEVKQCAERISAHASNIGIKCILQLHHGRLVTNPSLAWYIVRNCDPRYFGIMADTGNQCHEGMDNWPQALQLLGEHLAAIGIKNARPTFNAEGHCLRPWVGLEHGEVYFPDFTQTCKDTDFSGPFIFMPFYHQDDANLLKQQLIADIAYFRSFFTD